MKNRRVIFCAALSCMMLCGSGCKSLSETNGMKSIKKDVNNFVVRQDTEGRTIATTWHQWLAEERSKEGKVTEQVDGFIKRQDTEGRTIGRQWQSFLDNM